MFPFDHEDVGLVCFLVCPQIAEHFFPVAEAGHAILPGLCHVAVLFQDHASQGEQAAPVRLWLIEIETVVFVGHDARLFGCALISSFSGVFIPSVIPSKSLISKSFLL